MIREDPEKAKCKTMAEECPALTSGGEKLCELDINGKPEKKTREEKVARAKEYCGAEFRDTDPDCPKVDASADADHALENANLAVAQLEKELDSAKGNSDLSALTEVVRLAPTAVQPRSENVHEVAKVVKCLVTQVYADSHVAYCIRLMDRRQDLLRTKAKQTFGLLDWLSTLSGPKNSTRATITEITSDSSSTIAKWMTVLPDLDKKQKSEFFPFATTLFAVNTDIKNLSDVIDKACDKVTDALVGECK